jgi:hypothetical protein
MPGRTATIERDIPLFLIPHSELRSVRTYGDELERVIVRRTRSHFYTISIRTRPVKRELKKGGATSSRCTGISKKQRRE